MLARLQQVAALPSTIELHALDGAGRWQPVARSGSQARVGSTVLARAADVDPAEPLALDGQEFLALAEPLATAAGSAPLRIVLASSLDEALRPYRPVASAWALLLALGFGVALLGAVLIARGVSRPLERLAGHARAIATGNYRVPAPLAQRDEVGQLSLAFTNMARAIGEREERIRFQLDHDQLTGLPNRIAAETAIARALAAAPQGALLLFGLARLPEITQTLGHAVSDRWMRSTAERLRALAQEHLVARAADTQLLLWLPGCGRAEAIAAALRVLDGLAEPYHEADLTIDPAPTAGIALAPQHGASAGELLRHADVARYSVEASEDRVAVYQPESDPHRPERLSLMADLREALGGDQLSLHFQPKWNLRAQRIDGAEGLVRWQHPRHGEIAPDTFIELAERTGNVRPLTRWVLGAGIAQAQRWLLHGRPWRVALNLSARDLGDRELPRRVGELLALHRLPAERLLLEITESAVMSEPDAALRVLQGLAEQGVELAIDDFGVGHSSFAYLRRLPVREIKVDKSFAQRLASDTDDQAIVRAIVELGHRLGCRVTCEGVEDAAALAFLAAIGCDHAQGWAVARPLPASEFDRRFGRDADAIADLLR